MLSTALTLLTPLTYESSAAVLIERTKAPLISGERIEAPDMDEAMNTETQIVFARPVIEAVIDDLGLQGGAPAEGEAGLKARITAWMVANGLTTAVPPREGWIEDIRDALTVEPVVDSTVLRISFGSPDPGFAMRAVNAVTEAYIAHRRAIQSSRGAGDYFRRKMDEAGGELDRLRSALSDFKVQYNISALEESKNQIVRDVSLTRDRLADLRQQRAELTTRFAQSHPRVQVVSESIAAGEAEVERLGQELRDLESRQATIDDLTVLIASQESLFLDYKSRFEAERASEAAPESLVDAQVIEYGAVPARPKRERTFFIKLALVGGLVLALLIAFLREYFDSRARSPEEVEQALGVAVLGSVTKRGAIGRRGIGRT